MARVDEVPLRIMTLGDSITLGVGGGDTWLCGYRMRLDELLTQKGVFFDFVGSQGARKPGAPRCAKNEGHSGWKIGNDPSNHPGLILHVNEWLKESNPDIILLMIGINELSSPAVHAPVVGDSIKSMQILLKLIREHEPNVQLFVGSVTPTSRPWNKNIIEFNKGVRQLIQSLSQHDSKIYFVDLYGALYPVASKKWSSVFDDYLHPNRAGYDILADTWAKALSAHHAIW